jgi:uncharacterized coiled-coil DUF342 family protein
MIPPLAELELYASCLEEDKLELEKENGELRTRVAAYELTIFSKNVEIKRLREGLQELQATHPELREWAQSLRWDR